MKDFSNENVGKEYNKFKNTFLIGLACYAVAIVLIFAAATLKEKEAESLHEVIISDSATEKQAYIDVVEEPYNFAYYTGNPYEFYFVFDQDYGYVVRMSKAKYNELKSATEENPIRITGVTKTIPSEIKKIGVNFYNEGYEDKITLTDFEEIFGTIYIDLDATVSSANDIAIVFAALVAFFGLIFSLIGGMAVRRFKKKIKKIPVELRQEIDKEMNDKDAFYYKNAHTYLTEHYIVNFMYTFEAIPYEDVIWVYKYELRQNGIKTQQSIQVMTKDGKNHTIATLAGLTKKANDVFNEILETVATRSTNALIGYTNENRKEVKKLIVKKDKKKK